MFFINHFLQLSKIKQLLFLVTIRKNKMVNLGYVSKLKKELFEFELRLGSFLKK